MHVHHTHTPYVWLTESWTVRKSTRTILGSLLLVFCWDLLADRQDRLLSSGGSAEIERSGWRHWSCFQLSSYIYISFYICIHAWMLCSGGIHNLEQNEANYILGVWYYIVSAVRSEWDLVYSCTPNGELISKQVFDKWIHNSFKLMHLLLSASLHSIRSFIRWLGSDLMYLVTDCLTGSLTHRPRI